jgi:hypothetical protein
LPNPHGNPRTSNERITTNSALYMFVTHFLRQCPADPLQHFIRRVRMVFLVKGRQQAMANSVKPHLAVNPVVARLAQSKGEFLLLTRCMGYVGPSSGPGIVRLYFRLTDFSQYIEFKESAVVRTSRAPKSMLPSGGVFIWVKANTPIHAVRSMTMEARTLASVIARNRVLKRRWAQMQYRLAKSSLRHSKS